MIRERKVQGAQWYITLPKEWRNGHDIKKGDIVEAHFEDESLLVINPQNREMTLLEMTLVDVLISLPKLEDTKKLIETLKSIVEQLDKAT